MYFSSQPVLWSMSIYLLDIGLNIVFLSTRTNSIYVKRCHIEDRCVIIQFSETSLLYRNWMLMYTTVNSFINRNGLFNNKRS